MSKDSDELLDLPRITYIQRRKQVLSMDEFDLFNVEDSGIFFDRKACLEEKRRREVRQKFVLLD